MRYGRKIRKAVAEIEERTRGSHTCPKCERISVKRIGTGIWKCTKCGYTFTGGTYVSRTSVGITAQRTVRRIMERSAEMGLGEAKEAEAEGSVAAGGE